MKYGHCPKKVSSFGYAYIYDGYSPMLRNLVVEGAIINLIRRFNYG